MNSSDPINKSRKSILRDLAFELHNKGREKTEVDPIAAKEFRHLADRMTELYKRGDARQLDSFFGVETPKEKS